MDDDYLADDAAAALRGAGAEVLCPCPSEGAAAATFFAEKRSDPRRARSKAARCWTRFEIGRSMKARGAQFVFITGYDPDVIPPECGDVKRLQKPVPFRLLAEAVRELQALLRRCANSLFHPFARPMLQAEQHFHAPFWTRMRQSLATGAVPRSRLWTSRPGRARQLRSGLTEFCC